MGAGWALPSAPARQPDTFPVRTCLAWCLPFARPPLPPVPGRAAWSSALALALACGKSPVTLQLPPEAKRAGSSTWKMNLKAAGECHLHRQRRRRDHCPGEVPPHRSAHPLSQRVGPVLSLTWDRNAGSERLRGNRLGFLAGGPVRVMFGLESGLGERRQSGTVVGVLPGESRCLGGTPTPAGGLPAAGQSHRSNEGTARGVRSGIRFTGNIPLSWVLSGSSVSEAGFIFSIYQAT